MIKARLKTMRSLAALSAELAALKCLQAEIATDPPSSNFGATRLDGLERAFRAEL